MSLLSPAPPLRQLSLRQIQWITAGFALTFSSLPGQTIFIAQFNTALRSEFGLSHGAFGLIYTGATLMSSITLVWAGALTDKMPARRLALISLGGLGLMALGMAGVMHIAMLAGLLFGLRLFGQGMMSQIAMTTMSRWFNRYRGRALALAQLGFPAGDASLPILVTLAIASFGWRQAWAGTAAMIALVLIPLIVVLLADPPDGARARARGEVNPDAAEALGAKGARWTRRAVLRDPLFYLAIPGFMGPPAIGTLFIFHQAHLAMLKGWEPALFAAFYPVLSLTAVVMALISGTFIDRFGAWRIVPLILIPQGIGCLVIGAMEPLWSLPLFLGLFGATMGMSQPVVGALWAEIYGTAHIGAIRALASALFVFASAVGPGLAGVLIDADFDLEAQAFYYAGFCFVAACGYVLLAPRFGRRAAELLD